MAKPELTIDDWGEDIAVVSSSRALFDQHKETNIKLEAALVSLQEMSAKFARMEKTMAKLVATIEGLQGEVREVNSLCVGVSERKRNRWLRSKQPFKFQADHASTMRPTPGTLMLK